MLNEKNISDLNAPQIVTVPVAGLDFVPSFFQAFGVSMNLLFVSSALAGSSSRKGFKLGCPS